MKDNGRVAVVYDWLVTGAGGERVLAEVLSFFPQADLFSLIDFLPADQRKFLEGRRIHTSFLQRAPFVRKNYRRYLPLMPVAAESLDVSGYDLIVSLSHAVAKGVLTGPHQTHVSYVFSPMRYALDLRHSYLKETGNDRGWKGLLAHALLSRLRIWDAVSSLNVDALATLSEFVRKRIFKSYGRDARVIFPSVALDTFAFSEKKSDYYVTVSRLVPYKRVDAIVEAFRRFPQRSLIVIGDGPERKKIQAQASPNVKLLGRIPEKEVVAWVRGARAFLFAAEEDFGLAPLEAQSCGTPVIAFGRGGALETLVGLDRSEPTAVFFDAQTSAAIEEAIHRFESLSRALDPRACRRNAERFSPDRFRREFRQFVEDAQGRSLGKSGPP